MVFVFFVDTLYTEVSVYIPFIVLTLPQCVVLILNHLHIVIDYDLGLIDIFQYHHRELF